MKINEINGRIKISEKLKKQKENSMNKNTDRPEINETNIIQKINKPKNSSRQGLIKLMHFSQD